MSPTWILKWALVIGLLAGGSFECRTGDDDDDDDIKSSSVIPVPSARTTEAMA